MIFSGWHQRLHESFVRSPDHIRSTLGDHGLSAGESIDAFLDWSETWLVSWCFEPSQPQRITSGLGQKLGISMFRTVFNWSLSYFVLALLILFYFFIFFILEF